jgi:hypothetical protein
MPVAALWFRCIQYAKLEGVASLTVIRKFSKRRIRISARLRCVAPSAADWIIKLELDIGYPTRATCSRGRGWLREERTR